MARPRKVSSRVFGCPPLLWFDDPEKLLHFLGRSIATLLRWQKHGLKIHGISTGRGAARWIETAEFFEFLHAAEARGEAWLIEEAA